MFSIAAVAFCAFALSRTENEAGNGLRSSAADAFARSGKSRENSRRASSFEKNCTAAASPLFEIMSLSADTCSGRASSRR
jgi:hypothetical protein